MVYPATKQRVEKLRGREEMVIDLAGAPVLVTGGARGIGFASAAKLAKAGARVVIADRRAELAREAAERIGATSYELDISDQDMVESVVEQIEKEVEPLEILVNCAGNLQNTVAPGDLDQKIWTRSSACICAEPIW